MSSVTSGWRRLVWLFAAAFAAAALPAAVLGAEPAPPPPAAPGAALLEGAWDGVVELPTNMKLNFRAAFSKAEDGSAKATIDIPMQGLHGVPLRDVACEGEVVRFTFGPPSMPTAAWATFEVTLAEGGKTASGHMQQHGQKFPVKMTLAAEGAAAGAANRPQEPRPPYPYTTRELSFVNPKDGTRLVGTLTIPGQPKGDELVSSTKHPAVVLLTGSGPQDRDETIFGHKPFAVLADHLARHGIASLRCDDRGVGSSAGELSAATLEDLASDVKAAIAILRRQPDIDPTRIGLIGHSEGGIVAPVVAAEDPTVRYIVLMAGTGLPGSEILRMQSIAILRTAGVPEAKIEEQMASHRRVLELAAAEPVDAAALKAELIKLIRLQMAAAPGGPQQATDEQVAQAADQHASGMTTPWFRSFSAYDPRPGLRKVRCAVLALNGALDLQVPAKENLKAIEGALREGGNQNIDIVECAGLNHMFQPATTGAIEEYALIETTIAPEVLERITAWVRSKTGLPAEAAGGAGDPGAAK